jgi:hypothetical protein
MLIADSIVVQLSQPNAQSAYGHAQIGSKNHRVNTEWRLAIFGLHPIMIEKSALAGEGGVARDARTHPFSY